MRNCHTPGLPVQDRTIHFKIFNSNVDKMGDRNILSHVPVYGTNTMTIVTCGIWMAALLLLAFGIDRVYSLLLGGRMYRLFMIPGALVHHISQSIACILTGASISKVKFFDARESTVTHSDPKVPGAGPILIALAPIAACGGMLFLVPLITGNELHIGANLPILTDFSLDAISTWAKLFIDNCTSTLKYFGAAHYTIPLIILLYLGLVLSLAVGMDVRGLRFSIFGIAIATGAAYIFDGAMKKSISTFTESQIIPLLSFAVPITTLFFMLSLGLAAVASVFRKRSRRQQSKEEIRERLAKLAET